MEWDGRDPYRLRSEPSVPPRNAVITALKEVSYIDSTDPKTSLYRDIDLEAMDALLLHCRDTEVSVTFSLSDMTVTTWIDDENRVIVEVTDRTS